MKRTGLSEVLESPCALSQAKRKHSAISRRAPAPTIRTPSPETSESGSEAETTQPWQEGATKSRPGRIGDRDFYCWRMLAILWLTPLGIAYLIEE